MAALLLFVLGFDQSRAIGLGRGLGPEPEMAREDEHTTDGSKAHREREEWPPPS
jgi:hypothetical protein